MIVHQTGCTLDAVHWLRHAIAAAGHMVSETPDARNADRLSAVSLLDTLARFTELDDWDTTTLHTVANHATLMNRDWFKDQCTCGAFDSDDRSSGDNQ